MRISVFERPAITVVAIACGLLISPAFSEVIHFDNPPSGQPGHFNTSTIEGTIYFDIRRASDDQPGVNGPSAFRYYTFDGAGVYDSYIWKMTSGAVLDSDDHVDSNYPGPNDYIVYENRIDVACSDPIGAAQSLWKSNSRVVICSYSEDTGEIHFGIAPGEQGYVGVRFEVNGETFYGWILMRRESSSHFDMGVNFLGWAYETEPNTPIVAGAPNGCCPGDLNTTASVDVSDLFRLLSAFGTDGRGADLAEPFDVVDEDDLLVLLTLWGDCS